MTTQTVAELIDAKGGPAVFAEKVKRSANNVCVWKFRNRIPRTAWPEVIEAFPEISIADLKGIEAQAA